MGGGGHPHYIPPVASPLRPKMPRGNILKKHSTVLAEKTHMKLFETHMEVAGW